MGRTQGKLIADIGMTLDEVRQRSSLKLGEGHYTGDDAGEYNGPGNTTVSSSDVVFDFELAGSPGVQFKDCQYYLMRTGDNNDLKLAEINIGIAPRKLKWAELVKAMRETQKRLIDDGWKPARYKEGMTAEEALNKASTEAAPAEYFHVGYTWGKGNVALTLSAKRMQKAEGGEDPAAKADFINFLKLEPRSRWEKSANPFGHTLP